MEQPKIGLALGSGGARGFAHLGVIKVLIEAGIPIDLIAGSSMGALVAAFMERELIWNVFINYLLHLKENTFWILQFRKWGLLQGKK